MRVINYEQGSDEWRAARTGVITGTRLKQVLSKTNKSLIYELIAEQLAPAQETIATTAMERGTDLEEDAILLWESTTGLEAEQIGFVLHKEHDWLGCSPDALVAENKKYIGAVEVKCPDTKTHIKYLVEKKIPSEYKAQVINYFLNVDTLEWLDFVSYDPRIAVEELQLSVVRVHREDLETEIEDVYEKLLKFRATWEQLQEQLIF